jgi:hypothetical protein
LNLKIQNFIIRDAYLCILHCLVHLHVYLVWNLRHFQFILLSRRIHFSGVGEEASRMKKTANDGPVAANN